MTPTIELDGLIRSHWTEAETTNARLIHGFVQTLMNDHDFDAVLEHFGNASYVQHNRTMTDGINGVVETVERLVKRFSEYSYDVKNIIASGDRVVFHSHVTMRKSHRGDESKGLIIFDMWRIEDGAIVEHWDSLQALDLPMRMYLASTGGKIRNDNGVF